MERETSFKGDNYFKICDMYYVLYIYIQFGIFKSNIIFINIFGMHGILMI